MKVNCHASHEIRYLLDSGSPYRLQASLLGIDNVVPKLQRKVPRLNVNFLSCSNDRLEYGGGGGRFLVRCHFTDRLQV
jgi:hypothetical protein